MKLGVLAIAMLSACLGASTNNCPGGAVCPPDKACTASGGCALGEQITACDGQSEGAQCTYAGTLGTCMGSVCIGSLCGNGAIDPGELCDWADDPSCRKDCLKLAVCGDNMLDAFAGEQCDDGNTVAADGCSPTCQIEACGNGVLDPGEACDDGNNVSGDSCSSDCRSNETCGNGIIDVVNGEQCDEGAANSNAPNALCRTDCKPARCGDGIVDTAAGEYCDGAPPALVQCTDYGFDYGRIGCSPQCSPGFPHCGFMGFHKVFTAPQVFFESIFGTGPDNIFAAGADGQNGKSYVAHFDGTAWTKQSVPVLQPTIPGLHAVWAAGPTDAWAGGDGGLFHYDGTSWTRRDDSPTYPNIIRGIWGFASNDVYAVGRSGTIVHFDGFAWMSVSSPTASDLKAVWGSSPTDLWVTGNTSVGDATFHYDGHSWTDPDPNFYIELAEGAGLAGGASSSVFVADDELSLVWILDSTSTFEPTDPGLTPSAVSSNGGDDVYAVGIGGASHYDGDFATWTQIASGTAGGLTCVWAAGPGNVFAAGGNDIVQGGVDWGSVASLSGLRMHATSGVTPAAVFGLISGYSVFDGFEVVLLLRGGGGTGLWASSTGEVFAAGARFNGTHWLPSNAAYAIWGASPSDVYATDPLNSQLLHFDGVAWTKLAFLTSNGLYAMSGTSKNDVYAAGAQGTIFHYDGNSWSKMTPGTTANFSAVYAASATRLFAAAGDAILMYDAGSWSTSTTTSNFVSSLTGSGPGDVYAAIGQNSVLHFDGTGWTSTGWSGDVYWLWERAPGELYATGTAGGFYRYDGSSWTTIPGSKNGNQVQGLYGNASDVFVVYIDGTVMRWDGSAWHTMIEGGASVNATWATPGYGYAVGENGTVYETQGTTTTTRVDPGTFTASLRAVWASGPSDIWAVGVDGADSVVLHFDGSWTETTVAPGGQGFSTVWGASSSDIYAAGLYGSTYHWNGSSWTAVAPGSVSQLWGTGPSDVYAIEAIGQGPGLRHYDGMAWSTVAGVSALSVWGNAPDDVFAVSNSGIVHFDGVAWSPVRAPTPDGFANVWGQGGNFLFTDYHYNTWRLAGRLPR
jgi:cysteine-rich repeat protein